MHSYPDFFNTSMIWFLVPCGAASYICTKRVSFSIEARALSVDEYSENASMVTEISASATTKMIE